MRASLDERNQKATPSVARIVGITIASMMPSELNRICRSAAAIGPFGSSTPSVAAAECRGADQGKSEYNAYRISDLVCFDDGGTGCDRVRVVLGFGLDRLAAVRSTMRRGRGRPSIAAIAGKQRREQHEQVENGKHEQAMSRASVGLTAPVQLQGKRNKDRSADDGGRAVDRARKPERPRAAPKPAPEERYR